MTAPRSTCTSAAAPMPPASSRSSRDESPTRTPIVPRSHAWTARASLIGGVVAWDGNHFTEFVYFTSEQQARQEELAPGHSVALEQRWSVSQDPTYLDLRQPWLVSPGT